MSSEVSITVLSRTTEATIVKPTEKGRQTPASATIPSKNFRNSWPHARKHLRHLIAHGSKAVTCMTGLLPVPAAVSGSSRPKFLNCVMSICCSLRGLCRTSYFERERLYRRGLMVEPFFFFWKKSLKKLADVRPSLCINHRPGQVIRRRKTHVLEGGKVTSWKSEATSAVNPSPG